VELLGQLHATPAGLTSEEAARRRLVHGPKSLVEESRFAGLTSEGMTAAVGLDRRGRRKKTKVALDNSLTPTRARC